VHDVLPRFAPDAGAIDRGFGIMRIASLLAATALAGFLGGGARPAQALGACDGDFGFSFSGAQCEVTTSGYYSISAYGAEGGGGPNGATGGLGASATGTFFLAAGTVLDLFAGQAGTAGYRNFQQAPLVFGGGGGGGSFVTINGAGTLLLVAGGGGGASGTGLAGQEALSRRNGRARGPRRIGGRRRGRGWEWRQLVGQLRQRRLGPAQLLRRDGRCGAGYAAGLAGLHGGQRHLPLPHLRRRRHWRRRRRRRR
jgi:hypothetical protein